MKSKDTPTGGSSASGTITPTIVNAGPSALQQDLSGLHLQDEVDEVEREKEQERYKERPVMNMKQEELVSKVKKDEEESGRMGISLIVVGKST